MNISILDWIGYIASLIVLISLLMSSIVKLRLVNCIGAAIFGIYGFMIGSIPTGVMNVGIVIINLYYLSKMYKTEDYYHLLSVETSSHYFKHFIDFYRDDIKRFSNIDDFDIENKTMSFYVLRNLVTAGVFIANEIDSQTLRVEMDYAVPEYRDFKVGKYIYDTHKNLFLEAGYSKLVFSPTNPKQEKYIQKMGFVKTNLKNEIVYSKLIS